jgi:hypothetical protein
MIAVERTMGEAVNITMTDLTLDQALAMLCVLNDTRKSKDYSDLLAMGFYPPDPEEAPHEYQLWLDTYDMPLHSLAALLDRAMEGPMVEVIDQDTGGKAT